MSLHKPDLFALATDTIERGLSKTGKKLMKSFMGFATPLGIILSATLFHSQVVHASAPVVPAGDQQINYSVSAYGASVADTTRQNRDLSAPLRWDYPTATAIAAAGNTAPMVSASAITQTPTSYRDSVSIFARAALDYFVVVNGPGDAIDVPVHFSGMLSVTSGGDGTASSNSGSSSSAGFTIEQYTANPYAVSNSFVGYLYIKQIFAQSRYNNQTLHDWFNVSSSVTVRSGSYLLAVITAETRVQDGGTGSAYADPYFTIDPAFSALHPGYSLIFSPSIANNAPLSAVPEPSAWMTMVGGLGLVGYMFRRRRALIGAIL